MGSGGSVLVVDDSRVVRRLARGMLEGFGFAVREAADGAEALAACRAAMPDAVLLDWNMPVLDGIGFLKHLRADHPSPLPRVILCTTETELARIVEALEAGADEYIMKPFDAGILADKLRQVGLLPAEA
jgi:two-component system chemotaxis response regulator CheY